ncbi:hypothetical protein RM543_06835 [Roseicyclus sp. F158]|uniref:DUF4168 domain-containing protein n=1 Tax=Tropicimonas omnivorans TaxID=3075590 RepID=A0ABU3DFR0_9RHOB|nr:hypothetical protein [Roseicyclus sp. F158]MDT0682393.1 hypothetical protein [Roseicyclus sp. F158]
MKRFMITTALVLGTSTMAFAQDAEVAGPTGTDQLRDTVAQELATVAPDVDVDALTSRQLSALYVILSSEDMALEQQNAVESIVADSQYEMDMEDPMYVTMGQSTQIREYVSSELAVRNYDVDTATLSDEQVSTLYAILSSGDDADATEIEAVIE